MTLRTEQKIIIGAIIFYIVFFSTFVCLRHYNFQTQTWDMGIFVQTFWNTINGKIMFNNVEEASNHLGVHMSPFLFLLVPGYSLFTSPYYLLIVQTIALALGALPLYLLAKRVLPARNASPARSRYSVSGGHSDAGGPTQSPFPLIITLGYLLYPSLHWVNLFDFHAVSFLIPLLLAAFYFLHIKNWLWSGIFLALAASTKEDAILVVMFVGIYLLLRKSTRKFGLWVAILALIWFLLATQVIMPALGGGLIRMDRYANLGSTPVEIVQNVIQQPTLLLKTIFNTAKFRYLLWLFLPVAFLPLLAGSALVLLIPGLAENLLTTFEFQFTGFYQYDSVLIAGIFIGAIYGLKTFLNRWPNKAKQAKWVLVTAILAGYIMRSPVNPIFFPTDIFKSNPRWEAFRQMVKIVPKDATVAAQTNIVPHLSNREHAYMIGHEPFLVDVVLIDATDSFGFADDITFQAYVDQYMDSGQYKATLLENRYLILYKNEK